MTKNFLLALGALCFSLSSVQLAKADIITIVPIGSPVIAGGTATWTYSAELTSDEELTTGSPGFGSVYGFNFGSDPAVVTAETGLLAIPADFTFSLAPTMTEAHNQTFTYPTCSTCDVIRFTYDGTTTLSGGGSALPLGTFTVVSSLTNSISSSYDGQAVNTFGGGLNGNSGSIMVASAVPEPMTVGLLGGGLALLGVARLRRRSQKA